MASRDEAGWEALMRFSATLEPPVKRAFLTVVEDLKQDLDNAQLTAWLQAGATEQVVAYIMGKLNLGPVIDAARKALALAATAAPVGLPALSVRFDVLNPRVLSYLQRAELARITNITADTRNGIRQFLLEGFRTQQAPAAMARQIRTVIGLTPQQTQAVANYRKALTTLQGNALERALRDKRFDPTVARALKLGEPLDPAYVDKLVGAYERRFLTFRAETIARTEALDALHAGQRLSWQASIDSGAVVEATLVRRWYVAKDERVCPACAPIPRLNPGGVAFSEPFRTTTGPLLGPTAHPKCRCVTFTRPRVE